MGLDPTQIPIKNWKPDPGFFLGFFFHVRDGGKTSYICIHRTYDNEGNPLGGSPQEWKVHLLTTQGL